MKFGLVIWRPLFCSGGFAGAVWRRLLDCGDQIWVDVRDVLFLEDVEWCFIRYFVEQELFFNCEYYTLRIQTLPDRVGLMIETSHPQNRNIGEIPFLGHIWILRDMVFLCFFPKRLRCFTIPKTLRGCVLLQGNQHEQTITFSSAQCGLLTNEWPQTHPVVHHCYHVIYTHRIHVTDFPGWCLERSDLERYGVSKLPSEWETIWRYLQVSKRVLVYLPTFIP